ncbi:MAG TPA: DUF748 domain-containing protein [Rhodocyclaceae bacterium]|nr:DUF748 domain-containing protein [Rhodocyclaceae bacterium]
MQKYAEILKYLRELPYLRAVKPSHWRRAAWVTSSLLVLIAVLGFLAAPPLVRMLVGKQGSELLGRSVSVERVRINPFAMSVTLEGLHIAEADGKSDFVSVASIYANVQASSVFRGGPVLSALRIERPQVHVVRLAAHHFNFSDILERFGKPSPEPSEPLRFALNNIELSGGRVAFDDVAAGQTHVVDKLEVGLPFISSIPSQVEILVKPHVEAEVNGAPFELQGQLKPFADRREASLQLDLEGFDLVRYLGYLPAALPVKVLRAALGAKVECVWTEHDKAPSDFSLRGDVVLSGVQITERDGTALLAFKQLQLGLQDVRLLTSPMQIAVRSITLVEPDVSVSRLPDASLSLQHLAKEAAKSLAAGASAPAAQARDVPPPRLTIAALSVHQGRVRLDDKAVEGGFKADLMSIEAQVQGFDLAGARDAAIKAEMQVEPAGKIGVQGNFNLAHMTADVRLTVDALRLERYLPYYAFAIGKGRPEGSIGASARLLVVPGKEAGKGTGIRITEAVLRMQDVMLPAFLPVAKGKPTTPPLLTLKSLVVDGVEVDVDKRLIVIDRLTSSDAQLRVERGANGKIDLLEVLNPGSARQRAEQPEMAPLIAAAAATEGEWLVRTTGKTEIRNWNISAIDHSGKQPVNLAVTSLGLDAEGFSTVRGSKGRFELSADVNRKGSIRVEGRAGVSPVAGEVKLDARALDLLFLQPYVSRMVRVLLTQGTLDARGDIAFDLSDSRTPRFSYGGDVSVRNFNSFDQINDADFLRWKNLTVKRLKLRSEPLSVSVAEVRLDDFYTRLILDQEGRFNLREMTQREDSEVPSAETSGAPAAITASAPASASADKPLDVRLDQVLFSGGNVNFSDRFIKPNYDANLTEVAGSLKGLSPDPSSLADLSIKALLDHSAPIEVAGQLNPMRQDKYLDIKARVSEVELTSMSPYAIRYVGYGINKGKLSMDVNYRIRDRKLTADNKIFLDQLTFGDRIESPEATKLPVLLAVNLLKDSHGVIDVNLPVSGTLDDPEFSIGGVIMRVIINLLSKAVTSPFALLGGGSGGEELAYVEFNAGLATLSKSAEEKLATLARALTERPALHLELTAKVDPVADVAGLKRASLNARLRARKASTMVAQGESVGEVDALPIKPEEYPQLLEQVYRAASFDKPKNAIGITKDIPAADMERLIIENTKIGEADLSSLANRREEVVREWLVGQGKIPAARIFVLEGASTAAKGEAGQMSLARVDFSLK